MMTSHATSSDAKGEMASALPITDAEFAASVLGSRLPVLVDFWAAWCGPCRLLAPLLDDLAGEYAGRLRVAKIDTEENEEQALRYRVHGLPTLLLFRDGVEVDRLVGALPKPLLKLWIERALGRP